MKLRAFGGCLELSAPILGTSDCLGATIDGKALDCAFAITFPLPGADGWTLTEPEFRERDWLLDEQFRERNWGVNVSPVGALITAVALDVKTTAVPHDEAGDALASYVQSGFSDQFALWMEDVSTYLELWTGLPSSAVYPMQTVGPRLHLFDDNDGSPHVVSPKPTAAAIRSVMKGDARPVTLTELRTAANLVSLGSPPEEPWKLFRRACRSGDKASTRSAVIDAGTAAEIALARVVKKSLTGCSEEASDHIVERAGGLVPLFLLFKKLRPEHETISRNQLDELSTTRNLAAHRGDQPSVDDLHKALQVARQLLDCLMPLPQANDN